MPKMIKAIYSPSLRTRYQIYDNNIYVGFGHQIQTKEIATERTMRHVAEQTDPYRFNVSPRICAEREIASTNDWVTIYEAE